MRILHTSDWHLGQHFINKTRQREHKLFIEWLLKQIEEHQVDAVIIAGDLFDTGTPPSYARELYNQFVVECHQRNCQLIVLAGNHDSVATLNESRQLLQQLNTSVISSVSNEPDALPKQLIELKDHQGEPAALLCAIPFIRPRDILYSQGGQSYNEKQTALAEAIAEHYQQLYSLAEEKRQLMAKKVPIIATGHLTVVGSKVSESVRDIYVGSIESLSAAIFPQVDYVALGHIHRPQKVTSDGHIRYSGSPIPLSFDELGSEKQVVLVDFIAGDGAQINTIQVPRFQPMLAMKGTLEEIETQVGSLPDKSDESLNTWLSVEVQHDDYLSDLQARIEQVVEGKSVELLQVKRARKNRENTITRKEQETLDELNPIEVFERRLAEEVFDNGEKGLPVRLKTLYREILHEVEERHNLTINTVKREKQNLDDKQRPEEMVTEGENFSLIAEVVDDTAETALSADQRQQEQQPIKQRKKSKLEQTTDQEKLEQNQLFVQEGLI